MTDTVTSTAAAESWIFTFGSGQQHDGKYVVIPGTYNEARAEMLRHFGNAWSFQYPAADRPDLDEAGMVEMPRMEWPTPAEAQRADEGDDAIEYEPTSSPTVLTFGAFNLPEARISAYAEGGDITDVIGDELSSAGYDLDTITMRFVDGGRAVEVLDSNDEFVLGTVTISQPKPDYWLTLAEDLHRAAVRVATLAGTGRKPTHVSLHIQLAGPGNADPTVSAVVDAVAAAFGVEAKSTKSAGGYYEHGGRTKLGDLHINPYGYVPAPEDPEKAALAARVAELEARLGKGGA